MYNEKKNGCRTSSLGFKKKKKNYVARLVRHFWKMVVSRLLCTFLKNLRLFDWNMAGLSINLMTYFSSRTTG